MSDSSGSQEVLYVLGLAGKTLPFLETVFMGPSAFPRLYVSSFKNLQVERVITKCGAKVGLQLDVKVNELIVITMCFSIQTVYHIDPSPTFADN